ncbi:hypothetical protein K438DRAFT_1773579 [Mycena galopus ATCC 62051]|nr:hypothetical protein K438DRAFT_1773579 [Mycena galopus ATCC 62051]
MRPPRNSTNQYISATQKKKKHNGKRNGKNTLLITNKPATIHIPAVVAQQATAVVVQHWIAQLRDKQYETLARQPMQGFGCVDRRTRILRGQTPAHIRPAEAQSNQTQYLGYRVHPDGHKVYRAVLLNTIRILNPSTGLYGERLSHALVQFFVAPNSNTGKWALNNNSWNSQRLRQQSGQLDMELNASGSSALKSCTPAFTRTTPTVTHYVNHPVDKPPPFDISRMKCIGMTLGSGHVVLEARGQNAGCQPEDEDVDWNNSNIIFTCQGCKPRLPDELFFPREIVMLPDPQAENWQDEGVLWYPARFVKHHRNTGDPIRQFEFHFFDCIQWPQAQDNDFILLSMVHQDRNFCEAILKVLLKPNQIRLAANSTSNPPDHNPLVKIFDAAATPLAKLLIFWPEKPSGPHLGPIIASNWLSEALNNPEAEFAPLIRPPAARLIYVEMVSLPYEERRRRFLHVGRAMMHLLAIQHELEEPFNLNGDLFEDIVEEDIIRFGLEHEECGRAMFLATKPSQLEHKKHWDQQGFGEALLNF